MTAQNPNNTGKQTTRTRAASSRKPTPAGDFKKKMFTDPIELPSGAYMRVKRVGMQALIASGIMPNSLMEIAQLAAAKGGEHLAMTPADMSAMLNDTDELNKLTKFIDDVTVAIAYDPKVHLVPDNELERDDNLLYVDELDPEDKMFLFGLCTDGTMDVAKFRGELATTMDVVRGSQDLELPAK